MSISVSGLASGLDVDSIITQLLTVEKQPITLLQRKVADAEARKAAFGSLNGGLESLRTAARAFGDSKLFHTRTTTSGDSSVATVTASSDAPDGTHSLQVLQVATSHRIAAQGFIDESQSAVAAADGKISIQVGGVTKDVAVGATTTLGQLADAINKAGAGVHADIVNDGSPGNPYRLVLTSDTEGAGGAITITHNDTTLDFANKRIEAATADADNAADYLGQVTSGGAYTGTDNTTFVVDITQDGDADGDPGAARFRYSKDGGLTWDDNNGNGYEVTNAGPIALADGVQVNFTAGGTLRKGDTFRIDAFNPTLQTPQDALIKVNGINIVKSSNTVSDVFQGLTFQLNKAAPGQNVTLGVQSSLGDVEGKLTAFIGAYNSVVGFLNAQFAYDPQNADGQGPPPLNGDGAARQVQRTLKDFVTGRIPGLSGSTISSLGEIGITSDQKTGLVSLDTGKLEQVLNDDPTSVERLLTGFGEGLDAKFTYLRRSSNSQPGIYDVRVTQARTRAEVKGTAAAEVLNAAENLTFQYNAQAQDPNAAAKQIAVALAAADTPAQQVTKINQAFSDAAVGLTAFLDGDGKLTVRATAYGNDYSVSVTSDTAAGAGTTRIGNVAVASTGTNLVGTIGGHPARVLDGNHLKGSAGYPSADIEVIIPDDTSGALGRVRISDGLGESLPDVIDALGSTGNGIIASRTKGLDASIEEFNKQIDEQNNRVSQVEARLRKQFTALEVTMGQLQSLGSYVTQQLGGGK